MGLLGQGWEDPQSAAIMALAGGLLRGDVGAGLLGANNAYAQAKEGAFKQKYMQAQMSNLESEVEERKAKIAQAARRNQQIQGWMDSLDGAVPAANQAVIGQTGGLAPTRANAVLQTQALGQLQASNPLYGIPRDAIKTDLMFNDGKNVPDWMFKRGTPNIEFVNGVAVDKNQTKPGTSLPQMSPTGQGYQIIADAAAPGGYRVIAPAGAPELFGQYKGIEADITAGRDVMKVYNPQTQREEYVTRAQAVQRAQQQAQPQPQLQPQPMQPQPQGVPRPQMPTAGARMPTQQMPAPQPGVTGNFTGDPAAVRDRIMAKVTDPQEQANALAAVEEQARRTPGFAGGGNFAAGPSSSEATAAAVDKARRLKQAEADVVPTAQRQNGIAQANYLTAVIDQALNHPGRETATGASGTFDPRNYIPGTDATDFKTVLAQIKGSAFLQAFEGLKGGGQITEVEGAKATDAIARMNTAQSDAEFEKALREFRQVVQNGLTRAKANMTASTGATGSFAGDNSEMVKPKLVSALPQTAAKGTRARDTTTNSVLVFNGTAWVPEK